MIALIASGRPERPDTPTYYTVPWCPSIARHSRPQLPGSALRTMHIVAETCLRHGQRPSFFAEVTEVDLLLLLRERGWHGACAIVNFLGARRLILELQMYPTPEAQA